MGKMTTTTAAMEEDQTPKAPWMRIQEIMHLIQRSQVHHRIHQETPK